MAQPQSGPRILTESIGPRVPWSPGKKPTMNGLQDDDGTTGTVNQERGREARGPVETTPAVGKGAMEEVACDAPAHDAPDSF